MGNCTSSTSTAAKTSSAAATPNRTGSHQPSTSETSQNTAAHQSPTPFSAPHTTLLHPSIPPCQACHVDRQHQTETLSLLPVVPNGNSHPSQQPPVVRHSHQQLHLQLHHQHHHATTTHHPAAPATEVVPPSSQAETCEVEGAPLFMVMPSSPSNVPDSCPLPTHVVRRNTTTHTNNTPYGASCFAYPDSPQCCPRNWDGGLLVVQTAAAVSVRDADLLSTSPLTPTESLLPVEPMPSTLSNGGPPVTAHHVQRLQVELLRPLLADMPPMLGDEGMGMEFPGSDDRNAKTRGDRDDIGDVADEHGHSGSQHDATGADDLDSGKEAPRLASVLKKLSMDNIRVWIETSSHEELLAAAPLSIHDGTDGIDDS